MKKNPVWMRIYAAAKKRGVSDQTIYRWRRENKIPKEAIRYVQITKKVMEIDYRFVPKN